MVNCIRAFVLLKSSSALSTAQFLTLGTLFSAAGATTAVITVTSVLNSLLQRFRWMVCSRVFTVLANYRNRGARTGVSTLHQISFLAFINGLVVYARVAGAAAAAPIRSYRWWP